jgi:hypothetical protein
MKVRLKPFAFLGAILSLVAAGYSLLGFLMVGSMSGTYSFDAGRRAANLWGVSAIASSIMFAVCVTWLIRAKR